MSIWMSVSTTHCLSQVLYHSLSSMAKIGSENLIREDFIHAIVNFAMVSTGGILIGLVWVCVTAFATKFVLHIQLTLSIICFSFFYTFKVSCKYCSIIVIALLDNLEVAITYIFF